MEANYNNPARHATNLTLAPFDTLRRAQGSAQGSAQGADQGIAQDSA